MEILGGNACFSYLNFDASSTRASIDRQGYTAIYDKSVGLIITTHLLMHRTCCRYFFFFCFFKKIKILFGLKLSCRCNACQIEIIMWCVYSSQQLLSRSQIFCNSNIKLGKKLSKFYKTPLIMSQFT